jgi:hypothetical protein
MKPPADLPPPTLLRQLGSSVLIVLGIALVLAVLFVQVWMPDQEAFDPGECCDSFRQAVSPGRPHG